jgi:nucleoside-diphosphate-sugar epimerase
MAAAVDTDRRAIDALGAALAGTGRPLVIAAGTLGLAPGRPATGEDVHDRNRPTRRPSEEAALAMISRGVRASEVRLAPSVHDRDKQCLVTYMIALARKKGVPAFVGDGKNRWPAVHRLDAAHLFRPALEKGSAGARYHGVAEEGVPLRDIADVIGRRLNVPVVGKSADDLFLELIDRFAVAFDTTNWANRTDPTDRMYSASGGWRPFSLRTANSLVRCPAR